MKGINIKGKNYIMVNERLKHFRSSEEYKGWCLTSELVSLDNDCCVIKAIICDENGVIKATGFAQEDRTSSMINKTSFVENCETSAWGRALGNLGIGIDESIASAEEVDMAIKKQELNQNVSRETVLEPKTQSEVCEDCLETVTQVVAQYSNKVYGKCLCRACQKKHTPKEVSV